MQGFLAMALAMAMMSENTLHAEEKPRKYTPNKNEPNEVIPKGMRWFCFRKNGTFKDYEKDSAMLREEVYFRCYAINSKNAIKKFNKFKKANE